MTSKSKTSPGTDKVRRQRYRVKVKEIIDNIKESEPCYYCGEDDPVVKQFHHKKGEVKLYDVGNSWRSHGIASVIAEIAKCRVVCGNCHLRIHAGTIKEE